MSYRTFHKEIVRAVTGAPGRFAAIFAIVALGVGFYAGLMMTGPDMNRAADAFYDETNLMDIRVVSSMGLTDEDIEALREVKGVADVMAAYETDVMAETDDEPYAIRIHSLSEDEGQADDTEDASDGMAVASEDGEGINMLVLDEGRWPTARGECVISADRIMNTPVEVGDVFKVTQGTSDLESVLDVTTFEVVGLVHSSYYTSSTTMGSTSLGTGRIQQFMYVLPGNFSADYPYTEAFIAVEGARVLDSSSAQYDALVADVASRVEEVAEKQAQARLDEIKADAQAELDESRATFEAERADAEQQLADAKANLDATPAKLEASERELEDGQRQYDSGLSQFETQKRQAQTTLSAAESSIERRRESLKASQESLAQREADFEAAKPEMSALQIAVTEAALEFTRSQIASSQEQLNAAEQRLAQQREEMQRQLDQAESQLAASKAQIDAGRRQLEAGRASYEQGLVDYDASRAEADQRFADAEAELDAAQEQLDALEAPEWLVMDRTKNYGAESFAQDAMRINRIAQVFPLIFFLVAALVALTTMTRMVDDERMLIGTYKALGYSRARILSKYLIYALAASLGGSVVGIALLSFTLPAIIMVAYSIVYIVPIGALAIDWPIAVGATALGVGITLVATWGAVVSTLRESPAALMLPKTPKAGKRIMLERIGPLWSRLSFLWKVTCRNIFRYKKRMVMTVIGIAGCTALLLTGFGLQNSINDIIDIHFGELVRYNTTIVIEDDATADDETALQKLLEEEGQVEQAATAMERTVVAIGENGDYAAPIVVPTDADEYAEIHVLRERVSHDPLSITSDGALLTEKLGTLLGVGAGDVIEVAEPDSMGNPTGNRSRIKVAGFIENYVDNGIYLNDAYYRSVFGTPVEDELGEVGYNTIFIDSTLDEEGRAQLAHDARQIDGVKTLAYNDETIDSYRSSLNSVNMVVYVLIIAAALLAFIVLYNLTNINITERIREIATLKVLGFTPRETQHYIFREIIILSILGALVGLILGVFLEGFVVVTAEIDAAMFGRTIHWDSFVYAFVLTMVFTFIVTLFMRRKLNKVDMVESLKSNE